MPTPARRATSFIVARPRGEDIDPSSDIDVTFRSFVLIILVDGA
jgi:hypothetical protein